jgi:DNA-binding response OmpR family regulator
MEVGADDYLVKPFSIQSCWPGVLALPRRSRSTGRPAQERDPVLAASPFHLRPTSGRYARSSPSGHELASGSASEISSRLDAPSWSTAA